MTVGDVKTEVILPTCGPATLDPRAAAAEAIGAYLLSLHFRKNNGTDLRAPVSSFQLRNVQREWPEAKKKLEYPCASIIDLGQSDYEAANMTPMCREETVGKFGEGTVLWQIAELGADFQIDFWANDKPTREAIAAALPGAFSPGENFGVWLECSDRYYRETVRATLVNSVREDDGSSAYAREWRLRTTVRVQISVLDLRRAARATFVATVTDIGPEIATNAGDGQH